MGLLDSLEEGTTDNAAYNELMILELYHKLYPYILSEFRHKADCTMCHSTLQAMTAWGPAPILSSGAERAITSAEASASSAAHASADEAYEASVQLVKSGVSTTVGL